MPTTYILAEMMRKKSNIKTIKVIQNNVTYEMTEESANKFLDTAKKFVDNGIYAVKNGDSIIIRNESFKDKKSLKDRVNDYKKKGYEVFFNEKK